MSRLRAQPRFIVDINVGRLAKWLRAMGYDAVLLPQADDAELVRVALREERIVLTRDSRLMERRVVRTGQIQALLVRGDDVESQLRQVIRAYQLDGANSFSRCIRCNLPLEDIDREAVRGLVPPYVFETQTEFMRCPACSRVYWKGTHWANMRRDMEELREG